MDYGSSGAGGDHGGSFGPVFPPAEPGIRSRVGNATKTMNTEKLCALLLLASAVASGQVPPAQGGGPRLRLPSPKLNFQNSPKFHDLIRAGNLYLSLSDALALALENNLDIELSRFSL